MLDALWWLLLGACLALTWRAWRWHGVARRLRSENAMLVFRVREAQRDAETARHLADLERKDAEEARRSLGYSPATVARY